MTEAKTLHILVDRREYIGDLELEVRIIENVSIAKISIIRSTKEKVNQFFDFRNNIMLFIILVGTAFMLYGLRAVRIAYNDQPPLDDLLSIMFLLGLFANFILSLEYIINPKNDNYLGTHKIVIDKQKRTIRNEYGFSVTIPKEVIVEKREDGIYLFTVTQENQKGHTIQRLLYWYLNGAYYPIDQ